VSLGVIRVAVASSETECLVISCGVTCLVSEVTGSWRLLEEELPGMGASIVVFVVIYSAKPIVG
jgi:hypothetical protein